MINYIRNHKALSIIVGVILSLFAGYQVLDMVAHKFSIHPITALEMLLSYLFVIFLIVVILILPKKIRKIGIMISALLVTSLIVFFIYRHFDEKQQIVEMRSQLEQYLAEKFPEEQWTITRFKSRSKPLSHFQVEFESEKGWIYTYSVKDDQICQVVWQPPEGELITDAHHFERCEF